MPTYCRIILPPATKIDDVAKVLGKLSGLESGRMVLGFRPDSGWSLQVPGAKATCSVIMEPQMGQIVIQSHSRQLLRRVDYHFEYDRGQRLMLPPSTPFWVAAGRRLVEFFGGTVQYNDESEGFTSPRPSYLAATERAWQKRQQEMEAVLPISEVELREAATYAFYKEEIQ